jgi:hypothetical protein
MSSTAVWAPERPRILFMHIPKTAGMTLRDFLSNQYSISQIMPAVGWLDLLSIDRHEFDKYRLFQGHFSYGIIDILPPDVRPIVFLREPIARTISHLKHMRRDPNFHPAHKLAVGRSLDELVRDDRIMKLCSNIQVAHLSNDIPAQTILAGLQQEQDAGRVPNPDAYALEPDLAKAERNLNRFQYVGFVETFQEDIRQMSLALGLHPPRFVAKRNDDPEGETNADELRPETSALLREHNAADIAFYAAAKRRPRLGWDAVATALLDPVVYVPISQPMDFPLSGPIPGSNWYPCERDATGEIRWAGPLHETGLELPLARQHRFELTLTVIIRNLDDLSVDVGGVEVPLHLHWSAGRSHRISFWVPSEAVQWLGLTSLCFRTKQVFRASHADVRMLSFAVQELLISKVEPAYRVTAEPAPSAVRLDASGAGTATPVGDTPTDAIPRKLVEFLPPPEPGAYGLRLDPESRVAVLGEPAGFFRDGWVVSGARLECRALQAVTSMSLELWVPPGDGELTVTARVSGAPIAAVRVAKGTASLIEFPVDMAAEEAFTVELAADHEQQLSETDLRRAAYVLRRISIS